MPVYSYRVACWRQGRWEFRDGIHSEKVYMATSDRILGRASSGAGFAEEITCTPFARSLLDDATATAAQSTLNMANPNNTFYVSPQFSGMASPYYTTIGSALAAVNTTNRSTVVVYAGTYNEKITMVNNTTLICVGNVAMRPATANSTPVVSIPSGAKCRIVGGMVFDMSAHNLSCKLIDANADCEIEVFGLALSSHYENPSYIWDLYVGSAAVRFTAANWQRLSVGNANGQLDARTTKLWDTSVTAGVARIQSFYLHDKVYNTGGTTILSNTTWTAYNYDDHFVQVTGGTVEVFNCNADTSGVTANVVNCSGGTFRAYNSRFGNDVAYYVISQTSTAVVEIFNCFVQGAHQGVLLFQNTGTLRVVNTLIKNNRSTGTSYGIEVVGTGGKIGIDNCRIVQATGPATINSLYGNNARNIVNWGSSATHAKHANITIVGDTTYTVDATNVW